MRREPEVANAFATVGDAAFVFFANRVGLSGPFGIALLGIDHGIRRVEKPRVAQRLPLQKHRAASFGLRLNSTPISAEGIPSILVWMSQTPFQANVNLMGRFPNHRSGGPA